MDYIGESGKRYTIIEPAIGKGGEGAVYHIAGMPSYVLKVFNPAKRTEARHRKLLIMIHTPMPDAAMEQITWPIDVVYERNQFVGYVMPKISNNEDLNVMYTEKYVCTLAEKITIAKNLCAAINSVHNAGQVCGDLNPKNISVDPSSARVTLVDTDSYHITERDGSRVYRCEVGLPEYLPREVQEKMRNGSRLETAPLPTFTKYTDLFALAVHIFALLMNGCHPFACAVDSGSLNIAHLSSSQPSVSAPQPIDNICSGFFPFQMKRVGITFPKYAPEYSYLPERIRDLFKRAFIDGHNAPYERPNCVEWYNALDEMQNSLVACKKNQKHMYPRNCSACPWCEMESRFKSQNTIQLKQTRINTNQQYIPPQNRATRPVPITNSTPSAKASTIQGSSTPSSGIGKWIAIVVGLILLIVLIKSCNSSPSYTNTSSLKDNNSAEVEEQVETDPVFSEITIPALAVNAKDIPSLETSSYTVDAAVFYSFSGNISEDKQKDEFWFTADYSGRYRVDISELKNGTNVELLVYDSSGTTIGSDTYCCNEEGITLKGLLAGQTYKICVRQDSGYSSYSLRVGAQKPTIDISSITSLSDSVEFTGQRNVYSFTAPIDGRYRFELSEMQNGTDVELCMFNHLEETIGSDTYCCNGEGITVKDLKAGETYEIQVRQDSGFSGYTLSVGHQKPTVDISNLSIVTDSVEYRDQRNVYTFTVPIDGRYRFELSGMLNGTDVELLMFNYLGETIASDTYCCNGEGITVKDLKAGDVYEVQVRQDSGLSSYTLSIGYQKETIVVERLCKVYDSIEYVDQRNVYSLPTDYSGEVHVTVTDMLNDVSFELYVFNDLDETITSDTYCCNGESIVFNTTPGKQYEIQVRQDSGYSSYTLIID